MAAGSTGNPTLRALMIDADLSNTALASGVVRAGAAEGIHLGTTATSVSRMLDGCQPRWPVPRLVATVLSRHLGYHVAVPDCGFADRAPMGDTFNGFQTSPTIDGTIATVAELSGRDLNRRNFMVGSAFAAAAFAEPAWLALTSSPASEFSRVGVSRIGMGDVEVLRETVRHFEQLHRRHGGGRVRTQVVQLVHQQSRLMREGTYGERVGCALSATLAEATFLAGLTTVDSGRHALGQQYYTQSLGLAMRAGDRSFGANVLAEMSRVTIDVGTNVVDAGRDGQHAAALARSALQVIGGDATPAVAAYLHAIEARGLSLVGDPRGATDALDAARKAFDRGPGDEPDWLGHYGEVDLDSDIGQCLRDTGRPRQGVALLERALSTLPAGRATSRAKTRVHIAAGYLELREFEQADTVTAEALDAVGVLSSERTVERVRGLRRRARQHGARQVEERISEFLAT
ncbi:hypothetical protein [Actinokineospora sp.]|uniref:hypothetical protein n=1 Tax=Actinokineospora sp. TaxID=1872133 RepID=UPI00403816EC